MRDLYDRLKAVGFSRPFLRECVLPDWWADELARIPSNRAYVETLFARQLGLELSTLRDARKPLKLERTVAARFKSRLGVKPGELDIAQLLAARLAGIAATVCVRPYEPTASSASEIRQHLLAGDKPWVGLSQLLDYCWERGIPVVHLCRLPMGAKKMDGMAIWSYERPVIVLASQRRQYAWQLFILAHELGHVACGHIQQGAAGHVDGSVTDDWGAGEEREANDFAIELLTGDPGMVFRPRSFLLKAETLAETANAIGRRLRVDPGHVVLNYCREQRFFAVGSRALEILYPSADASATLKRGYEHLDLEVLAEDTSQLFDCLTSKSS